MASRKRDKKEREHDLVLVADLYFKGHPQAKIGERLGLSQQQISYDLKALQKRWEKESLQHYGSFKARELAKVDNLEREYWDAWSRSQEEAETRTVTKDSKGGSTVDRYEGQVGDSRFLSGVQWCIAKRCEILGLNAASRNINIDVTGLSDDQLERVTKGEDVWDVIADPS